jgi:hypothetical protein
MIPKMLKEMERRAKELLDNREKLAVVKADETARNKLIAYYEKEIVEAEGFAEEIHQEYIRMQNVPPDNRNNRYPNVMQEISGDYVYVKDHFIGVLKNVLEALRS